MKEREIERNKKEWERKKERRNKRLENISFTTRKIKERKKIGWERERDREI